MNTKLISIGRGNYVSPVVKPLEIESEGLLCMSAKDADIDSGTLEDWGNL